MKSLGELARGIKDLVSPKKTTEGNTDVATSRNIDEIRLANLKKSAQNVLRSTSIQGEVQSQTGVQPPSTRPVESLPPITVNTPAQNETTKPVPTVTPRPPMPEVTPRPASEIAVRPTPITNPTEIPNSTPASETMPSTPLPTLENQPLTNVRTIPESSTAQNQPISPTTPSKN